ncbi:MAG: hypothetical protein K9J83_07330 [Desulfarculaceae bacterium]|nr:hypothetical protein [Desulfarculaceae bacterium]
MLKKDLIKRSPAVRIIGEEEIENVHFGAVLSRAGVGKTRYLVQIALTKLLKNEKILHISLNDPIEKIKARYLEAYNDLVDSIGYVDPQKALRLWEEIKNEKIALSYNENTFDPEKIKVYLKSFKKDDLALPALIVMDGLDFDRDLNETLTELEKISERFGLPVWYSMQTHREQDFAQSGYPVQLEKVKGRFDKAVFLHPKNDKIESVVLTDESRPNEYYLLDPATMMIVE